MNSGAINNDSVQKALGLLGEAHLKVSLSRMELSKVSDFDSVWRDLVLAQKAITSAMTSVVSHRIGGNSHRIDEGNDSIRHPAVNLHVDYCRGLY